MILDTLISSKTRVKLLIKFFLNPESRAYLRSLESEFGESTNSIRVELNRFEEAGLLEAESQGNRKIFKARRSHPLFKELQGIILKHTGLDQIIANVVERLGDLDRVYVTGDLAKGLDSSVIDLIFVGNPDKNYLLRLIDKSEKLSGRKIRFLIYSIEEAKKQEFKGEEYLLIWNER